MAFLPRKLAHFQDPGPADPGWGQRQRWGLTGADPSVSIYDADFGASETPFHRQLHAGILRMWQREPLSAPTMNRSGRVSAQHNSSPAARFFQSYTGSGTGHSWSGNSSAYTHGLLNMNFNRNMQGAAELHPATTYDPFPSPSSLYPKVV